MFKELYKEVQGNCIISVEMNITFIYGSLSDWEQEGMICLHELISREEGLVEDIPSFKEIF